MCDHLRAHFSAEVSEMTPAELHEAVRMAIARARVYRLTSARDICRFLNLCAVFGWEFDADETLGDVLRDTRIANPSVRLQRLYARCVRRLEVEEQNERMQAGAPQ